ncbi:MAG: D-alanyl-D-alanine carboxypeptidase [Clostridiaceae bacterium]|nr:D-alanyl-D-alanine carboxypeptidase [Clostridiaceae bacterium]
MTKRLTAAISLALVLFFSLPASAVNSEPKIDATSALMIELRRGQVLYSKNPDEPLHIAAASKLMTALIAIEKLGANAMVTASKEAVNTEGALLGLTVGEKYLAESLIYASMLNNANDATIALAEAVGGTVEGFVKMMNDYAASLNMKNTVFANPTGKYSENQRTTASDLAILLRHALTTNSTFDTVFSSQAKPWFDEEKTIVLTNLNDMFWSYDGVDGGKVDYNDPKYQTVITTVTRGQQRLLCILLDSPPDSMYSDSMKLFDYGFSNFRRGILVSKGQTLDSRVIEGHEVSLIVGNDVYYTYPVGENYILEFKIETVEENFKLPIYKNTLLGTAQFTLVDGTVITVDLFPDREILPEMSEFDKIKKRIMEYKEIFYIVVGLAVIEVILLIIKLVRWIVKKSNKR